MKPRIAIVGGGITGVLAAYFLARRGAQPTIIERDRIAGQASGHNAGGLNPLHGPGIPGPMAKLALESLRLHLELWEPVRRLTGVDFGGRLVPRILVAVDQTEAAALAEREALHNTTPGFAARWLSTGELARAAPNWQCMRSQHSGQRAMLGSTPGLTLKRWPGRPSDSGRGRYGHRLASCALATAVPPASCSIRGWSSATAW